MKKTSKLWIITLLVWGVIFLFGKLPVAKVSAATNLVQMAGYTTYYDEKVAGRSENIRLSARFIDGIVLQAYGEFSFNQTVGARTKERGFQDANVIVDGQFVLGVGGGVCQVSTTLYNAALYAGLKVVEYHPHTLSVGYVPPSQDAMVSSRCDLRLFNPYDFPVKIEIKTGEGAVKARIYGSEKGKKREIVSRVIGSVLPPEPLVVQGEEEGVIREGKSGIVSESYLECYQNGVLVGRKLLRKDSYAPTRGIIAKKSADKG